MTGTAKTVVSMCVLLLAALVVYYGMTPPEQSQGQLVDLPEKRPSLFGGDPVEKLSYLGFPPIATTLTPPVESMTVDQMSFPIPVVMPITETMPMTEGMQIQIEPIVIVPEIPEQADVEIVAVVEETYKLYTVLEGETLGEIASRELGSYRLWREIASINKISDPSRVMPGRVLRMPTRMSRLVTTKSSKPLPSGIIPAGAQTHIVTEGETLSSIAGDYYDNVNKYGVIERANPSINPNRLKIGARIIIPQL